MHLKAEDLKRVVKEKYGQIAGQSSEKKSCGCGPLCCGPEADYTIFSENYSDRSGYHPEADLGLGCGIPTDFAGIKQGDHVLDLGSGAGNDCFVARSLVGETGRVTGIDFTEQMIDKARENCRKLGYDNVEFVSGDIEQMPLPDNSFDVVISNCVLNLVPGKSKAFNEIFRVLRPGGHLCVSDVVIKGSLPEKLRKDAEMYAGCVSGASEMSDYIGLIENSGFRNIRIHKQKEIGLPDALISEFGKPDKETGIFSITVSAHKPV
ncbi:MAG: arsenite methyltransferase [Bacteroidales bacterium]|nr:arsenite methyltransferase [Bacteroidales bacterium]